MSKLFGNKIERWVHSQFHKIETEVGVDVDKVAEIIELWDDACDAELINNRCESLFATLSSEQTGTASDDQFLKNLAQWIIEWMGNVNVAQRLNIIATKLQDEIRKSWNIL